MISVKDRGKAGGSVEGVDCTNGKRMRCDAEVLGRVGGVEGKIPPEGGVTDLAQDHDLEIPSHREFRTPRTCRIEY